MKKCSAQCLDLSVISRFNLVGDSENIRKVKYMLNILGKQNLGNVISPNVCGVNTLTAA